MRFWSNLLLNLAIVLGLFGGMVMLVLSGETPNGYQLAGIGLFIFSGYCAGYSWARVFPPKNGKQVHG